MMAPMDSPQRLPGSRSFLRQAARRLRVWHLLPLLMVAVLVPPFDAAAAEASTSDRSVRESVVDARRFQFEPSVVRVQRGERVRLVLESHDVTHGITLEEYGVHLRAVPGEAAQVEFVADRPGRYNFRCSQVCGGLHPFMTGSLVVEPNQPLWAMYGLAGLLVVGFLMYAGLNRRAPDIAGAAQPGASIVVVEQERVAQAVWHGVKVDSLRNTLLRWLLKRRSFQFALLLPGFAVMLLLILAGFYGSPVGNHNLAIVLLWSLWWPILVLALIPLGGRAWCAACPVPAPGEWLQRLSLVRRWQGKPFTMGWRWPRWLNGGWPQTGLFLAVAAASMTVLTSPFVTAVALVAFVGGALVLSLLFRGRAFCRHVCPLSGFIGLYSLASPLALRVKDREVCKHHLKKSCVTGNECGYGCPWFEYPGTMDRNINCGLCMECVKTCPKWNIVVGLLPPGHDLVHVREKRGEAYRAGVMLAVALVYTAVVYGPWDWLRAWAGNTVVAGPVAYLGILIGVSLLAVPGLLWVASYWFTRLSGTKGLSVSRVWASMGYALVPMGLAAWMAFALSPLSEGVSYLPSLLSDPVGRGWDLFGTAHAKWPPLFGGVLPYLQAGGILVGLVASLGVLRRRLVDLRPLHTRGLWLGLFPAMILLAGIAVALLWLFMG